MSTKPYKPVPPFKNRWLIKGRFTTLSELHVGDGGTGAIQDRQRAAKKGVPGKEDESDASTVCVAHGGRAYIPGSGLKGPLRALVSTLNPVTKETRIHPEWEALLGSDNPDDRSAVGGKLEFWDAFHSGGQGADAEAFIPQPQNKAHLHTDAKRPWWDKQRKTCVAVSVSLDRRTRTAKEHLLYHLEYVPADETFDFEISGDDLEEADIARLLLLLDQFNTGDAALGAQTSNGWGRVRCQVTEIRRLDATGLATWKQNPQPGLAACQPVNQATKQQIIAHLPPPVAERILDGADAASEQRNSDQNKTVKLPRDNDTLTIHLKLTLESPWLIRDPRQRERSEAAKKLVDQKKITEADKPPDAVAIQNESGKPFVPAKSLRGDLRSRAEMILRTLGFEIPDHPGDKTNTVSTKGKDTRTVIDEIADKDLATRLFGLSGWLAPLHIPRLIQQESPPDHHQESVGIDRLRGGAAYGAKFDACLAGATTLEGTLTLDLERLKLVDPERASLGLLALVLRDLAEGDIPIGSDSGKGQGFCTATAEIVENGTAHPSLSLTEWFRKSKLLEKSLAALRDPGLKHSPPPAGIDISAAAV